MSVLPVIDFRTYFLDRIFTDVIEGKITYQKAVSIVNESGITFSTREEAQTVLNSVSQSPSRPAQTYADLTKQKPVEDNSVVTRNYDLESSSAVSRIMVDPVRSRAEITYRGNNRTYSYTCPGSARVIRDAVRYGLESPGAYVHNLRSSRLIVPE
jgi:hypothetical protein